jgi:hypothetical protein
MKLTCRSNTFFISIGRNLLENQKQYQQKAMTKFYNPLPYPLSILAKFSIFQLFFH